MGVKTCCARTGGRGKHNFLDWRRISQSEIRNCGGGKRSGKSEGRQKTCPERS